MTKFLFALCAFFLFTAPAYAAPAYAAPINSAFTGPRAEVTAGIDNLGRDFNYGTAVGFDMPLGDRLTIGAEATANDFFGRERVLGVGGRLGLAVNTNLLLFGAVGYEDYRIRGLNGLRYGGGAELALGRFSYAKAEYRRGDDRQNTGLVGVGLRF